MKTLVIINIDETQNPLKWISNKAGFDLVFLCYSKSKQFQELLDQTGRNWHDYSSENNGKWKNIFRYLDMNPDCLSRYDYFWFPDPDLVMSIKQINKFLDFVEKLHFDLYQPSLTRDSFISYPFTRHRADMIYHKVDFVEIMCPLFKREALLKNLWTFDLTSSGYGIDCFLWGRDNNCCVVHKYQIRHPRKPNYKQTAMAAGFPDIDEEFEKVRELSNQES